MPTHILRIRDLGYETFWHLLHDAAEETPPSQNRPLRERIVALLSAAQPPYENTEDRLSLTCSVRRLGGEPEYLGPDDWETDITSLVQHASVYGLHADICCVHALLQTALEAFAAHCPAPVLNAGNDSGHPCLALGDLALFRALTPELDATRIAWIGGATGLAHSLIEAAIYAPFELFMALPEWGEPDRNLLGFALNAGAKIFLTRDVSMAMDGAHYVYAGSAPSATAHSASGELQPLASGMPVTPAVMALAKPDARLLAGSSRISSCRVDAALLETLTSLQTRRMEYRLRAQNALLPRLLSD